MIRFYAPDIESSPILPESDSQHCVRVLRMQPGDMLEVVDGAGHLFMCRLIDPHSKHAGIEIIDKTDLPPVWNYNVTIAVAPTKHLDRIEWLVEKLVEIGVNRIVPVKCMRSERKELKIERLEKIAVSAMKQSLKAVLPVVEPMMPLDKFMASVSPDDLKFVGYCDRNFDRKLLAREYNPGSSVTMLVGPEGDFTPDEIEMVTKQGFVPVTLGDNRLRTETAALVACDTFHIINQRAI